METTYASQAATLTTHDLLAILQTPEEYEPEAILAVIAVLEERGVQTLDLEENKQHAQAVLNAKQELEALPKTPAERLRGMLQLFIPQPGYYVTPILLNINLAIFIYMLLIGISFISPQAGQLFAIGGNYGPYTLSGQWWRLLTSTFLHAGILHLLFNMVALVSVGRQLELMIGRSTFIIAYLLCGIAGGLASIWWDGTRVGVGASGAIFGMFGLLLVLMALERKLTWAEKRAMMGNMGLIIGVNLLFGMKDGIDNAAHAGGLVVGMVQGVVLMLRSERLIAPIYSLKGNIITAIVGLVLFVTAYNLIPITGQMRYQYLMEQVAEKEIAAMQVFYEMAETDESNIDERFVPRIEAATELWSESEALLESLTEVEGKDKDHVLAMLDYVRLRKKSYELFSYDLQHGRPPMNERQEKVLWAVEGYINAIQQGRESQIVNANYRNVQELLQLHPKDHTMEVDGEAKEGMLVVIDGIKAGFTQDGALDGITADLDKDNIESTTILKGEQAKAIYGEDGANGALLITTMK
ncbi:rhomboid family protein [Pontibacter burrus]|uniref:Rhomboid family intramembrane serine protease n=1 Tax=Pontibacter burrus TaxID=2704466 RepID=A0A6B3LQ76_9BACT|nr:rhomboid family intramembrane serine protease [Pontibacter burrus]NEM96346.1 rhomboid family intramembrane serine protease [Pontibacter burrus]